MISPPFKRYHANAGDLIQYRETSDSDNGDTVFKADSIAMAARLSASQPASAFKPTRATSVTSSNSEMEKEGFGGFTQPAQVNNRSCIPPCI